MWITGGGIAATEVDDEVAYIDIGEPDLELAYRQFALDLGHHSRKDRALDGGHTRDLQESRAASTGQRRFGLRIITVEMVCWSVFGVMPLRVVSTSGNSGILSVSGW